MLILRNNVFGNERKSIEKPTKLKSLQKIPCNFKTKWKIPGKLKQSVDKLSTVCYIFKIFRNLFTIYFNWNIPICIIKKVCGKTDSYYNIKIENKVEVWLHFK